MEQETFGGKIVENCIAQGTLVLTDRGLVPIEKINASHLLWDGEAFVFHDGLIDKGMQEVLLVDGLLMTENHKILTERGWKACGKSAGLNWANVSLPDCVEARGKQSARKDTMAVSVYMRENNHRGNNRSETESTPRTVMWLYEAAPDSGKEYRTRHVTSPCFRGIAFHEAALFESEPQSVPQLWRTGNNGMFGMAGQFYTILERYGSQLLSWFGAGSSRQQRRIYTSELSMGLADNKCEEQEKVQDCRFAVRKNDCFGVERKNRNRRNNALVQAGSQLADGIVVHRAGFQAQVYDIRNCGPRHRFTVYDPVAQQYRIVSNCTQATARDLLAHAMLNLEAHDYRIVFHVHDECVMEMPVGVGSVEEACAIMGQTPEWCSDLPLRADGYECRSYRKS